MLLALVAHHLPQGDARRTKEHHSPSHNLPTSLLLFNNVIFLTKEQALESLHMRKDCFHEKFIFILIWNKNYLVGLFCLTLSFHYIQRNREWDS